MPQCIFIIHLSPVNSQLSLVIESKDRMNGWSVFLVPKHNFQSLLMSSLQDSNTSFPLLCRLISIVE